MDIVFIEGLEIEALIGIYDWERKIRQPLVFDLELGFDNRKPAASDDIADTLDWAELLDTLVSDFALALANGEAQYMPTVGDLMGRAADD